MKSLSKYINEVYSGDAYRNLAFYASGDQKQEYESMGKSRDSRLARVQQMGRQAEREARWGTGIRGMVRRLLGRGAIDPDQLTDVVSGASTPSVGSTDLYKTAQGLSDTELSQRTMAYLRAQRAKHLLGQVVYTPDAARSDPHTGRISLPPSPRQPSGPMRAVEREIGLRADQGLPVARITATDGVAIKQEIPTPNWETGGITWVDKIRERTVAAREAAKREREHAKWMRDQAKGNRTKK
jgi:hypothetical protein